MFPVLLLRLAFGRPPWPAHPDFEQYPRQIRGALQEPSSAPTEWASTKKASRCFLNPIRTCKTRLYTAKIRFALRFPAQLQRAQVDLYSSASVIIVMVQFWTYLKLLVNGILSLATLAIKYWVASDMPNMRQRHLRKACKSRTSECRVSWHGVPVSPRRHPLDHTSRIASYAWHLACTNRETLGMTVVGRTTSQIANARQTVRESSSKYSGSPQQVLGQAWHCNRCAVGRVCCKQPQRLLTRNA
ncbi:hypothetical protein QBC36DRAFT_79639 [Triangularia setosa]|uniref:Uncharacterized protein n=1 Tax=Triangularia setosa TaxID=2587417 RepID=A0AAN6VZN8_9PEZI|nr:hypothetical protein QBC36DRAFT_79639 [Podospora setosa]